VAETLPFKKHYTWRLRVANRGIEVMNWSNRKRKSAFTLIELLVTVLILAILMAVALPLYLSAVSDAQRKTCRANMQTIANAVQAKRVKTVAADYASVISGGVNATNLPDLPAAPICPSAGSYTLENGVGGTSATFRVKCSIAAHGTYEPGIDSN
jgi:type IV pilus assembly protein PilA